METINIEHLVDTSTAKDLIGIVAADEDGIRLVYGQMPKYEKNGSREYLLVKALTLHDIQHAPSDMY